MKSVGVSRYIEELQKKIQSSRIMSAVERQEWLTELIKNQKSKRYR